MKIFISLLLMLLLSPWALAISTQDDVDEPDFATVLVSQPVVVVAEPVEQLEIVKIEFDAIEDDAGGSKAATQQIALYQFKTVEVLAGKVPAEFTLRSVLQQKTSIFDIAIEKELPLLLVMAPDYGLDAEGKPRESYLVAHQAAYPVIDETITAPALSGTDRWSLEDIRNRLAANAKSRQQRLADSLEPEAARQVPVASGEDIERKETAVEEAPGLRATSVKPAAELAKYSPALAESPMAVDHQQAPERESGLGWYWLLVLLMIAVAVVIYRQK